MTYDYLIAGAGIFGSVFAYEANKRGYKCLVIDRRGHIGGDAYTENTEGINVHKYGAHIFHTSDKRVWDYINQFAEFNNYVNSPIAVYKDELYNLPFNMNTFSKLWGIKTPAEAVAVIEKQKREAGITEPKNLEEQAIFLAGTDIYEKLIKGYTEKQWGRPCTGLPPEIIKRVPLRFTYDNNYFTDRWQGIPVGGYTGIFEKLLDGVEVQLNTPYEKNMKAKKIIYTGAIDEFFDFCYGELEYRSLEFKNEILDCENYQGNAVINYTDSETPYTRIIEHKHFEKTDGGNKTVISYEYPKTWGRGDEPYYPINNERNNTLYQRYAELAKTRPDVIFGGRLGEYKYYDMDKVVLMALDVAGREFNGKTV